MAVSAPVAKRWTAAAFLALDTGTDRYELIEGEMQLSPAPAPLHQRLVTKVLLRLGLWAEESGAGSVFVAPIDIILSEEVVVQPDIVFYRAARCPPVGREPFRVPPDLVIEVLSASTARFDLTRKKDLYERHGVEHYWVLDTEQPGLTVYRLVGGGYEFVTEVFVDGAFEPEDFPGLKIELSRLWP